MNQNSKLFTNRLSKILFVFHIHISKLNILGCDNKLMKSIVHTYEYMVRLG